MLRHMLKLQFYQVISNLLKIYATTFFEAISSKDIIASSSLIYLYLFGKSGLGNTPIICKI